MDISHGLIHDYMRQRPLSPIDLSVEIREEEDELVVPESLIWDHVSMALGARRHLSRGYIEVSL